MKIVKIIFASLSIAFSISAMDNPKDSTSAQAKHLDAQAAIIIKMLETPAAASSELLILQKAKKELLEILSLLENDTWDMIHVNRLLENPLLLAALLRRVNLDSNPRFKWTLTEFANLHENNAVAHALFNLNARNRTSEESTTEAPKDEQIEDLMNSLLSISNDQERVNAFFVALAAAVPQEHYRLIMEKDFTVGRFW